MKVCVLGSANLDIVASVESLPRPGETVIADGLEHFPGGKGANQAIAAARLGVPTAFVGAVGEDASGQYLRDYLNQSGVDISNLVVKPKSPTGQAFISVASTGENAIVVVAGANAKLTGADFSTLVTGTGTDLPTVFLAQLESPIVAIEALFSSPAARSGCAILNAAPARREGAKLFPLANILVVNQIELAAYCGREIAATDESITTAARELLCAPEQIVIVTLGAAGAVVVDADRSFPVAARQVAVVDTTGAGDCFCGALAALLAAEKTLASAVAGANAAASISVQRLGAASSMPTRIEMEALVS